MKRDLSVTPFTDQEQIELRRACDQLVRKADFLAGAPTTNSDIRVRDLNDLYDAYMIVQRIALYIPDED